LWPAFYSYCRGRFVRHCSLQRSEVNPFSVQLCKGCRLHVQQLRSQLYTQDADGTFCNIRSVYVIKLFSYHVTSDANPVLHAGNYYAVQLSILPLKCCLNSIQITENNLLSLTQENAVDLHCVGRVT